VARIVHVGKGQGVARRAEEEEEAAGGDTPYLGIVPPQDETSQGEGRKHADNG
jgi:hypothetical protein